MKPSRNNLVIFAGFFMGLCAAVMLFGIRVTDLTAPPPIAAEIDSVSKARAPRQPCGVADVAVLRKEKSAARVLALLTSARHSNRKDSESRDSIPSPAVSLPQENRISRESGEIAASVFSNAPSQTAWIEANPTLPGNSLSLHGQRAEIQHYLPVSGAIGLGLSLNINAEAEGENAGLPETPVAVSNEIDTAPPVSDPAGFTYEQELFRTKWGWAAYDEVQKILMEETSP